MSVDRPPPKLKGDPMKTLLFTNGKTMLKTMKARVCLPMAAMFLTAVLAGPAAAEKQLPFRGSVQGRETDVFQGPPPGNTIGRWERHGNRHPAWSIYGDLERYGEPLGRFGNRVLSLHRGQRRQHLYYACRTG